MKDRIGFSKDRIAGLIRDFIQTSPNNTMSVETAQPARDDVMVGFDSRKALQRGELPPPPSPLA